MGSIQHLVSGVGALGSRMGPTDLSHIRGLFWVHVSGTVHLSVNPLIFLFLHPPISLSPIYFRNPLMSPTIIETIQH